MEPYNTCQHGVDIERYCRLCELMLEKELQRIKPRRKQQTAWIWIIILVGLLSWWAFVIWRLGR